jgi:hypothetical protein
MQSSSLYLHYIIFKVQLRRKKYFFLGPYEIPEEFFPLWIGADLLFLSTILYLSKNDWTDIKVTQS